MVIEEGFQELSQGRLPHIRLQADQRVLFYPVLEVTHSLGQRVLD